jgi:hypothetical protein
MLGLAARTRLFLESYARGTTLNVLLPGATVAGDTLRSLALQRSGNPLEVCVLSVLLDRLSGLWVLCAMSLAAFGGFALAGSAAGLPLGRAAALVYLAALAAALVLPWLPWRGGARATTPSPASPGTRLERLRARLVGLHALVLARRRVLLRSLWGSLAVQVLSAGSLWLCLRAVGGEAVGAASVVAVAAVAAPIFVAAALPVSLGGFGTREMAAAAACPLVGLPAELGVAAAALHGLTAVIVGLLAAPLLAVGPRASRGP